MDLKKILKIGFSVIILLVFIVVLSGFISMKQINQNNKLRNNIFKLISTQEEMGDLLNKLFYVLDIKQIDKIKDDFINSEKNFEKIEHKIKKSWLRFFVENISYNDYIDERIEKIYKNEHTIEDIFKQLVDIHTKRIKILNKLSIVKDNEKKSRYILEKQIVKLKDLELVKLFWDMKYYSKEAIYQYKDKKHLNNWIDAISILKLNKNVSINNIVSYENIALNIKNLIIDAINLESKELKLLDKTEHILKHNKKINKELEKKVEKITYNYTKTMTTYMLLLSFFIFIIILFISYKVYKYAEKDINYINEQINKGLKEITKLNKEIEDTQKEVVFTMGAIGEKRSKETGNHVKRVAEYSKILALEYGLNKKEAELLKQASPMHDIGKVAIPDNILNKPGRLTDKEFEIMKEHAKLGYEMLNHSKRPILKTAAIVAYEHHEKWDGSGYPRKLKGKDIHIYGRITAIADVFDALGSDRVYKKAWSDDKIISFFKEQRGKHFDPDLIDIFFKNFDKILQIREKFKDKFD